MAPRPGQGWHPEDIKAALRKRYGAITHLSVRWGYATSHITQAIRKSNYSRRVELRIAEALDLLPHILWPDRWSPDGKPLPRPRNPAPGNRKSSLSPAATHPQIEKAA